MRRLLGLAVLLGIAAVGWAEEKDSDKEKKIIAAQKAAADAVWKKMQYDKPIPPVETPHLLVYSRLSDARTKTLAGQLDKQMTAMLKALKYTATDRPWPGKLTVFLFEERRDFVEFMRTAEKKSPKEDDDSYFNFKGEETVLVVGAPRSERVLPEASAKRELAYALLRRKMGTGEPPEWIAEGFAAASIHRAGSPNTRYPQRPPAGIAITELWGENLNAKVRVPYSAAIIDYLAYGPMADQFATLINALRPGENGESPPIEDVLKSINLDANTLEFYARRYIKPPMPKK